MTEDAARLNKAAMQAMATGDMRGAQSLLVEALGRDRGNIRLWLNLAVARRQLSDPEGAFAALREALLLDNRNFPALLMQAALHDRLGRGIAAAQAYGIALAQAPPDSELDAPTRQAVERARAGDGPSRRPFGTWPLTKVTSTFATSSSPNSR